MKPQPDVCNICGKHTAPHWLGVKEELDWCVCIRTLNTTGDLWDHNEELVETVTRGRQLKATTLYVERLISHVEIGQRLKDIKRHYCVKVIDKIPRKGLLLVLMPTGKTKWCKASTIANLRVMTVWDKRKEREKST